MDPISATLVGMAFATFIKDAIEVWEKIEGSFARVSQNRRGAQRLVRELRTVLNDLKELYEENHAVLDKSGKTKTALTNLMERMKETHTTCTQLIPPLAEKRFQRYILKYYGWKNGSKIEEELLELRSDVDKCYKHFTMLACARTEVRLIETEVRVKELQRVTISRTDAIQNTLSECTISDNSIRSFNPPRSPISSSIIIDIPEEYLRLQLRSIVDLINHFSVSSIKEFNLAAGRRAMPLASIMDEGNTPRDRDSLHRNAVALTLEIRRFLESGFGTMPLGTSLIFNRKLVGMLHKLKMSKEAGALNSRKIRNFWLKSPKLASEVRQEIAETLACKFFDVRCRISLCGHQAPGFFPDRFFQDGSLLHRSMNECVNTLDQVSKFYDEHGEPVNHSADTRNLIEEMNKKIYVIHVRCPKSKPSQAREILLSKRIEKDMNRIKEDVKKLYALIK